MNNATDLLDNSLLDDSDEIIHPDILDVLLDSDSPLIEQVADQICDEVGFKGQKQHVKNHIRILLLNFIGLKKRKKNGYLRYSRRNEAWAEYNARMPNPLGITSKMDEVVDQLEKAGLLRKITGFATEEIKRQTRIQPTAEFTKRYIKPLKLLDVPLSYHKAFPPVRVHLKETLKPYEANGTTKIKGQLKAMKEQVRRYNALLKKTAITLVNTPETADVVNGIDYSLKKKVYRVFSDEEITKGGRYYGGWWQHEIKSGHRQYIRINGSPTVELDYASQHANLLYGLCLGKPMSDALGQGVDAYTFGYPRDLGKAVFTCALNVRKNNLKVSLENRFTKHLEGDSKSDQQGAALCLPYIQNDFDAVRNAFELHHKAVLKYLYPATKDKKWWGQLQFVDSQVCAYVLDKLTSLGIPCLSIHDSFIVETQHEDTLRKIMIEAYHKAEHTPSLVHCIPEIKPSSKKKTN